MTAKRAPVRTALYETQADGEKRCRVCEGLRGHVPTCALIALRLRVRELASQIGMHVATMRELLEDVDALVRGDREAP